MLRGSVDTPMDRANGDVTKGRTEPARAIPVSRVVRGLVGG